MADTYDYIIVGAGSAGAALAYRLTEEPRESVLLLEACSGVHPLARIPVSFGLFIDKPGVNWRYFSEPEAGTNNRVIPVPRGKMLGGSSSINMMAYVRGHRADYDRWRQMGLDGWSYSSVLPYFKRAQNFAEASTEYHGTDGPWNIQTTDIDDPIEIRSVRGRECRAGYDARKTE